MAAMTSGGEARPNFPDFNKVMMITGEIKEPKRIMPVYGFNGQELWPSDVGVKLGCQEDITAEGLAEGAPLSAKFNWMENDKQHVEGGRYVANEVTRKRPADKPIQVGKRIRQNIEHLSSEESDDDRDYIPKGNS